jgi:hypothetical protein
MCLSGRHTNPDGAQFDGPHFHRYIEGYDAKFVEVIPDFNSVEDALEDFCKRVNLPIPNMQGGGRS